jgi:3-methyladenine DNA glycosylase AlkD
MRDPLTRAALVRELKAAGSPERATGAARYFKTGAGEYGEGDVFLGVTTPALRKLARQYAALSLDDLQELLKAKEHECRAVALTILVAQHRAADAALQSKVLKLYLRNTQYINNWDLVDLSCGSIVGCHVRADAGKLLTKLARSKSLWERRIAMISTRALVREGDFDDALRVAELLLDDRHDLIHKAIGWVLREIGDKDRATLLKFLKTHYERVPRTTLRYAIEHFSPELRKQMLAGTFEV